MNIIYVVAVILLLLWLMGVIFKVAAGFIHVLLVIAVILVLVRVARSFMRR